MSLHSIERVPIAKKDSHHVVLRSEGGWSVKRSGATRASGNYSNKRDAVAAARQFSRNQGTELIVHGKDGQIQRRDSHGKDPFPPRG